MSFFQFQSKLTSEKEYSLPEIPVFSSLNPAEQRQIVKKARLEEYKRGDIVYEEGTVSEFFYVVISGRFRLFKRPRPNHSEETLTYFYRGDHFGETSLLSNQLHSATVEAKRDGLLLKLPKPDFLKLIHDIPSVALHISRSLGHRLTKDADPSIRREVKIVSLYSRSIHSDASDFWIDYAGQITKEVKGKVGLVDFSNDVTMAHFLGGERSNLVFDLGRMDPSDEQQLYKMLQPHPKGFDYLQVHAENLTEGQEKKVNTFLTFLTYRYNFLLLRLPTTDFTSMAFAVLKKSDCIYVYAPIHIANAADYAHSLSQFESSYGFSKSEIRVIVPNDVDHAELPYEEQEKLLGQKIFWLLPSKTKNQDRYEASLRYFAKELAGTLIGLALGSGAAYGLAHIGVIKVLEEIGVIPDIIAGTSIGALLGSLWAAGYSSNDLERLAKQLNKQTAFFQLVGFRDFHLFPKGFLKGEQVTRYLEQYLGNQTFQNLKIPMKIVATDLLTSEAVVLDSGRVVDAIRASIAIPGIFTPLELHGRYLIDGGVVDPLPVDVLAKMGVKKIIAVNVLAGPKERIERYNVKLQSERTLEQNAENHKQPLLSIGKLKKKPPHDADVNIFNIIMSTIQFMEFEIANYWGREADVLVHPIVLKGHWAEFYSADKFIRVGEERTREQTEEIKRLLSE